MAFSSELTWFNTGTGTSDITVSGIGFQPKAAILFWNGRTGSTDGIGRGDHFLGMGFAVSSASSGQCSVTCNADDANTVTDSNTAHSSASCLLSVSLAAAVDGAGSLKQFNSDGATFSVEDAFPRDQRVACLFLGGDDLTNTFVSRFTEHGSTGTKAISGVGFQPECVLLLSAMTSSAPAPTAAGGALGAFMLGCATSLASRWVCAVGSEGAGITTSDTQRYCLDDEVYAAFPTTMANAVVGRASQLSFTADGFDVNFVEVNSARYIFYLALRGGRYSAGTFATSTTTGTVVDVSLPFRPSGGLVASACSIEQAANTALSDGIISLGAWSSTTRQTAFTVMDDDAAGTMVVGLGYEQDHLYMAPSLTATLQATSRLTGLSTSGFSIEVDDADIAAPAFVAYLAFGDTPTAGAARFATFYNNYYQRAIVGND